MEAMKPEPISPADEHGIVLNFIINYTVMHHLFLLGCRRLGSCFTVMAISSLRETRGKEEAHDKLLNLRHEVWERRLERRFGGNGGAIWLYCICIFPGHEEDVGARILFFGGWKTGSSTPRRGWFKGRYAHPCKHTHTEPQTPQTSGGKVTRIQAH